MTTPNIDWAQAARDPRFVEMVEKKRKFLFSLMAFSVVFYFLLPLGAAYAPGLWATKIFGVVNFGLLFAISQFIVAWSIAFIYTRRANREFDAASEALKRDILAQAGQRA
ncbi:DUF485 domain-containing protein [Neomegalonema perideroedes]|uniref:DUF485 domain-containing protein n=1 Tax=Neomegalonema perideroedes TaxID=217219 RepID=UPI000370F2F2|nr:DUF485 domain-containing protein [Neomegalonema perideroedes]